MPESNACTTLLPPSTPQTRLLSPYSLRCRRARDAAEAANRANDETTIAPPLRVVAPWWVHAAADQRARETWRRWIGRWHDALQAVRCARLRWWWHAHAAWRALHSARDLQARSLRLDLTASLFSARLSRRRALRTLYRHTHPNVPSPCAPLEPVQHARAWVPAGGGDSKYVPSIRLLPPRSPELRDRRQRPGCDQLFEREAAYSLARSDTSPSCRPSAAAARWGTSGAAASWAGSSTAGLPRPGTASYRHGTFEPAAIKAAREQMQLQGRDVRLSERKDRISARSWTPTGMPAGSSSPGAASPSPRALPHASSPHAGGPSATPLATAYPRPSATPLATASSPRPASSGGRAPAAGLRATAGYCTPPPAGRLASARSSVASAERGTASSSNGKRPLSRPRAVPLLHSEAVTPSHHQPPRWR